MYYILYTVGFGRGAQVQGSAVGVRGGTVELFRITARTATIGALIVRIGFGAYYTIIMIRNPQKPYLII